MPNSSAKVPAQTVTPKAVVFDLGKVLLDFDYHIAARAIARKGKMTADQIWAFMLQSPLLVRYETGLLTSEEFFGEVCRSTGYCAAFQEFGQCFADIFSPIEPMVRLQADLNGRGVPTYIFSNTNHLAVHHIRKNFPFFGGFTDYILSFEHGSMKPDEKLYKVVEERCGRRGRDILYIDDRPENIETGLRRGWQTILQESPEKTMAVVRGLGLVNNDPY